MDIVARAKAIILQPKQEWSAIAREPGDIRYLLTSYVAILAAIPPICTFIGESVLGFGPFRIGFGAGLVHAIFSYVLTLVSVVVVAYIIDFLAGMFGAQKNIENAMKVAAYAPTAAWLAGVFNLIPALAILGLLGLYSLYLLHTGIVALMKPSPDKALFYTIAVVVSVMVIEAIVFFAIMRTIFGMPELAG